MIDLNTLEPNGHDKFRVGYGACGAHHGELFQGQIHDGAGHLRRCLVTLPCNNFQSRAVFQPDWTGHLRVDPARKEKTRRTVALVLESLGRRELGGVIRVTSNIEGSKGYGSSTADCVAAARAAADALRAPIGEDDIARLVVQAEQASDNVMFSNSALFAHREGVVLEHYFKPVPDIEVLSVDTEPDSSIDTVQYSPACYSAKEVRSFAMLAAALRRAIQTQDRRLLGQVATASADINQRFLPKPGYKELRSLAQHTGALGVAVAHSGTLLGIMLDPAFAATRAADALCDEVIRLGFAKVSRLRTAAVRAACGVA